MTKRPSFGPMLPYSGALALSMALIVAAGLRPTALDEHQL